MWRSHPGAEAASLDAAVSVEAMSYDATVDALRGALGSGASALTLWLKRIRPRGVARVTAVQRNGQELQFLQYEGENLRMGLIRNAGGKDIVNDQSSLRYDNKPAGTGDCGGNGLCCTCVVSVLQGKGALSPMRAGEAQLLRNVVRWRQSCRAYVRVDDGEEMDVRIQLAPRADEVEEGEAYA